MRCFDSNLIESPKKVIHIILFILVIFDPWFDGFYRGIVLGGVGLLFFNLYYKKNLYFNNRVVYFFSLFLIFTLISFLPAIYNATADYSVYFMYLKLILYLSIFYLLLISIDSQKEFISLLKGAVVFQFLVVIFCVIDFPGARKLMYFVHTVPSYYYDSEQSYRLYFFTSVAFFQLSLFFGFVFNYFLALFKENKVGLFYLFIIFLCGIFTGRSFLVFALISLVFYCFNIKSIILCGVTSIIVILFTLHFSNNEYVHHAMEPLLNFINKGEIETSSSDKLINHMLYIPGFKQLIFGDGIYYNTDGSYYGATDSGFVRQFLYGGVLYVLLCFFMQLFLLKKVALNWFINHRLFIISTLIIFTLGNVKADTYMYPGLTTFLVIILAMPLHKRISD